MYRDQVALLLDVLPEIAKENCFALHGGTAINLFVRDMPRISVDVDLTYLPMEGRANSIQNINTALERIKTDVEKTIPNVRVQHEPGQSKLFITRDHAMIKLEVNLIIRGIISPMQTMAYAQRHRKSLECFVP